MRPTECRFELQGERSLRVSSSAAKQRVREGGGRHRRCGEARRESELSRLATELNETGAAISPDGRWMAYQSDETGRFEVFARPFPNVVGGQVAHLVDGWLRADLVPGRKRALLSRQRASSYRRHPRGRPIQRRPATKTLGRKLLQYPPAALLRRLARWIALSHDRRRAGPSLTDGGSRRAPLVQRARASRSSRWQLEMVLQSGSTFSAY